MRVQYVNRYETPYGAPEIDTAFVIEKWKAAPTKDKAAIALYGAGAVGSGLLLLLVAGASIFIGTAFLSGVRDGWRDSE